MNIEQIKKKLNREAPKFARGVAPFYKLLEWKWALYGLRGLGIPSEKAILESIRDKIDMLKVHKKEYLVDFGGICVGYRLNSKDCIEYVMEFVVDLGSITRGNTFSEFNGWKKEVKKKVNLSLNIMTDTERNINV